MTTALLILRTVQTGLTLDDLDGVSLGMVYDILTESANDDCNYNVIADQSDFDRF